jgi:uncharacterized repeat protein (TIGR01451 family)
MIPNFSTALKSIRSFFRPSRRPLRRRDKCGRLFLEVLEDRIVPAGPVPTVALTAPATNLIGQDVPLSVAFSNTGTPGSVGYLPFVDVEMPVTGTAPPPPNNGISFNTGSATFLGAPVTTTVLTFDSSGNANHPYAKDASGAPLVIHGTPGDQLVVFLLPLGSVTVTEPAAVINFTGHVSVDADTTPSLPIAATGGFGFGADPADDPSSDPPIFGATDTENVTPTIMQLTKTYNGPEGETVTGPNFPQTYTLSLNVANGQTLHNVVLSDLLPNNVQFISVTSVTGNGATVITPTSVPSTSVPGGTLTYTFNTLLGTAAASEATVTFRFFVPQNDSTANPVLPLGTGASASSVDLASAQATWVSPNANIPSQSVSSDDSNTLTDDSLAVQKSVQDLNGASPKPGDTLQYTLNFQVSDYFALPADRSPSPIPADRERREPSRSAPKCSTPIA